MVDSAWLRKHNSLQADCGWFVVLRCLVNDDEELQTQQNGAFDGVRLRGGDARRRQATCGPYEIGSRKLIPKHSALSDDLICHGIALLAEPISTCARDEIKVQVVIMLRARSWSDHR